MTFRDYLKTLNVSDLTAPQKLVTVDASMTFSDAFSVLIDHHILSAPLFCKKENGFVGYLELRDLLSIVVGTFDPTATCTLESLLDAAKESLLGTDGVTLTYLARRHPFRSVKADATLFDVLALLSTKSATKVRRVAVVNKNNELVNVISASFVVTFLANHLENLGPAGQKTIASLPKFGTSPVSFAKESARAIDVYSMLDSTGLSGVAICKDNGTLCGNISARDLKSFVKSPSFAKLNLPIGEFLVDLRKEEIDIRIPTILAFDHNTVATIIGKIAATKVHRIFIVHSETDLKPKKVISVGDICAWLFAQ